MNRSELLGLLTLVVAMWGVLLDVIFRDIPESAVPFTTRVVWAVLVTLALVFVVPVAFRFAWLSAHFTLMIRTGVALTAVGLALFMGYVLDFTGYITWQWLVISGFLVVTWLNIIGSAFIISSILLYRWATMIMIALARDWKSTFKAKRSTPRKRTPRPQKPPSATPSSSLETK